MIPPVASARAAQLLIEFGGATYAGTTAVETAPDLELIAFDPQLTARISGHTYENENIEQILKALGCETNTTNQVWEVKAPSWRPDLTSPIDLVEEVIRIDGYEKVPTSLPTAPNGRGLTEAQKLRRRVGLFLAGRGLVEVRNYPFMGTNELDALAISSDDERRNAVTLANPLSDEQPLMRTTLLPGLISAVTRNTSRGFSDVPLFEIASVSFAVHSDAEVPRPSVLVKPKQDEITQLQALVPNQPTHIGAVITGSMQSAGWWGSSAAATWRDAIEIVIALATELGIEVQVQKADVAPWHPGRCAVIKSGDVVIGLAGELSPRVIAATGLPVRAVAFEINLDELLALANTTPTAPRIWTYPVAKEDIALVVDKGVSVGDLITCIKDAAGELLEDVKLFDIYTGSPIPEGQKSLAFALRFRASERTLSAEEVASVRTSAVTAASEKFGAVLRG